MTLTTTATPCKTFAPILAGGQLATEISFAIGALSRDQLEDAAADAEIAFTEYTNSDDLRSALLSKTIAIGGITLPVEGSIGGDTVRYGYAEPTTPSATTALWEQPVHVPKLFVNDGGGKFVAQIVLHSKSADTYRPEEPWLLLYNTGRTDRFATQLEAKTEARKTWVNCSFQKSAT